MSQGTFAAIYLGYCLLTLPAVTWLAAKVNEKVGPNDWGVELISGGMTFGLWIAQISLVAYAVDASGIISAH